MTQTLLVVVLFVGAMAMLPWLVRRLQQRQAPGGSVPGGSALRVLSAVAVGPQQRVVTVEVGPEHARTWLVLGVTASSVTCLHVVPRVQEPSGMATAPAAHSASFAQQMAVATLDTGKPANG